MNFDIMLLPFSNDGGWAQVGGQFFLAQPAGCGGTGDGGTHVITFTYQGLAISIDNGPWQDDWPLGFSVTTCSFASAFGTRCIATACGGADILSSSEATFDLFSVGPFTCAGGPSGVSWGPIDITALAMNVSAALTLKSAILSITGKSSRLRQVASMEIVTRDGVPLTGYHISGTGTAFAFSWDMPQDGEDAAVGETITITSDFDTAPLTSMDLSHITLSWPCGIIVPIIQTPTLLTFLVPESCDGDGAQTLTATGDGTQFSGSVPLGVLTILLTNASGIYSLVPGKRNDTYYSSHRDGTTVDIKIPNPTARTGFIGG